MARKTDEERLDDIKRKQQELANLEKELEEKVSKKKHEALSKKLKVVGQVLIDQNLEDISESDLRKVTHEAARIYKKRIELAPVT